MATDPLESTRVDRWLWAVRLCSTRTESTELCRAGHVLLNGAPAKAASPVKPGDRIEARIHQRERIVEVVQVIEKRVGAPIAATCLVDHSPPPPSRDEQVAAIFTREPSAGRPTKRDRRQLDRFRTR